MKKLTDIQRKWVLTASLASVLSFNLVMGLTGTNYGSTNLASKAAEKSQDPNMKLEPFISDKGEELKVKYIQENSEQTAAIVPEMLEGGACYTCGKKYLLPKNFDSSATSLEAALRKAMSKKSEVSSDGEDLDQKLASRKKQKITTEADDQSEDKDIAALKLKCENKENDSRTECFSNGLTRLLKSSSANRKKKKEYKKEEIMALFKEEIQPGLISGLKDISDLLPARRMRNDPFADIDTEKDNRREKTQNLVEDMISSIDKKYNYLRQQLTAIAAKAVLANQEDAQRKLKQADQIKQSNPGQALRLQGEGYARREAATQVANQIGGSLYDGLSSAQWSNLINQDQFDNLYQDNYANVVNAAIQGMATSPLTYVIPSVALSDGSVIVDGNGQTFTLTPRNSPLIQQRTAGRGITVMSNGLTAANTANQSTPRIATLNAIENPGTATIQVFHATQAPTVSAPNPSILRPGR